MLDLDSPRWGTLRECGGSARDVPEMLRALAEDPGCDDDDDVWEPLWTSLCHQGTVYTASYAAVPHLVGMAVGFEPEHQVMCWVFVGSVARSTDGPPVPDDLRAMYDAALVRCEPLIRATLGEGSFEVVDVVHLLGAIAAVRGHHGVSHALDYLCDGFAPQCPQCEAALSVELDGDRLFVTVDEPAPPRAKRRLVVDRPDPAPRRADPSLPTWAEERVTEHLLALAEQAGHPELVAQLIAWEGIATCPACEHRFALRPTLVAQAA